MYNFHTHIPLTCDCLLNFNPGELDSNIRECSVGLHPWQVDEDWKERLEILRTEACCSNVCAIGECGIDKASGGDVLRQIEVFRMQVALAEELHKPVIVHCVKAFDELLAARKELVESCRSRGVEPQPWVVHGFRGKPEQAKQIMTKGILLSFGHHYNVETLRFVFSTSYPFFLETDDLRLSVRQIYEQASHHLGVDVSRLVSLCDPRQTIFSGRLCR